MPPSAKEIKLKSDAAQQAIACFRHGLQNARHVDTGEAAAPFLDHARDRMVNALGAGLVGRPELLAERLRRYQAIGIACIMTRFSPMLPCIELFGSKVIPRLRG